MTRDLVRRQRDEQAGCETCRELFGAAAVLAVPITIGEEQRAVVAAFGLSGDPSGRNFRAARHLAEHLAFSLKFSAVDRQAKRRASELAAVTEIAANLTSVIDAEVLFPKILAEIDRVLPCDATNLYLLDAAERRLRVVAGRGYSRDEERALEETAWERMPGAVFRSQKSVLIRDWRDIRNHLTAKQLALVNKVRAATTFKVRSAIWIPIVFAGESLGAIALSSANRNAFSDRDRELVTSLANHAAIAVANAQFYRVVDVRLRSKLRDLTVLSGIGQAIGASIEIGTVLQNIARGTAEGFGPSASAIALLDDEHDELTVAAAYGLESIYTGKRIPAAGTASGWIVRHDQPLFVPWLANTAFQSLRETFEAERVESFMGVPLRIQGKAVGSLNLYSRRGQRFEATDVDLLQGMAAQAAIAIDHANLYKSAAQERAKLEATIASMNQGLLLVNPDGTIDYVSPRFTNLLGLDDRAVMYRAVDQVWNWLARRCTRPAEAGEQLRQLKGDSLEAPILTLIRPYRKDLEVQGFTVRDRNGDSLGQGYLVRDVSAQTEIDRLKSTILSTVSHELRTPLTTIKALATALLCSDLEWDQVSQREFVMQIEHEADQLNALVRNLLDMSRLEAGTFRLSREWCDLSEWLKDIVGRMPPLVADHQIRVVAAAENVTAQVDRRLLERVVWNLVENAVKYSRAGTTVTVAVARHARNAVLSVADEGIGIEPDERERIFERFYRGSGARTRAGAGLGLAICRGIIGGHGGTITVESEAGRGSTFTICIPAGDRGEEA